MKFETNRKIDQGEHNAMRIKENYLNIMSSYKHKIKIKHYGEQRLFLKKSGKNLIRILKYLRLLK